uniref:Uncharacterized protein n=1 Tax=Picea sitchensis TaxID=3332 RepID=D5ADD6_PICSI|nr:unknown [Picea sitchensis]
MQTAFMDFPGYSLRRLNGRRRVRVYGLSWVKPSEVELSETSSSVAWRAARADYYLHIENNIYVQMGVCWCWRL